VVVAQGFKTFLSRLAPLESETNARLRHTVSIYQAIVREFGRVQRPERIGSHSRQTAIRRYSDVDFLIRVPRAQALWGGQRVASTTTLRRLRETLEERFRDTSVHIDGPAVVAEFADGRDAVDVVPAIYEGTTGRDGYPVFLIPDGSGGWLRTSPHRHSRYILQQVVRSGGKLQAVVRFLKAWKFARTPEIPVVGFHIELLLAGSELCVGAKTYADCLLQAFSLLRHRRGSALLDPLGLFGPVPLARTPAQMESVLRSIDHAQSHAMAACLAQENGRVAEAFRQWNIVFNGDFPAPPGRFRT
jgi:hypothetical protein